MIKDGSTVTSCSIKSNGNIRWGKKNNSISSDLFLWIIPGRIIPAMRLRKAGRYTITSTQASMISIFAKSRKRQEQTKRKKSMLIKSSVTAAYNKMVSQYNY